MVTGFDIDWQALRPALQRLAVVTVVAAVLVGGSAWYRHQQQVQYEEQARQYQSDRNGYRDVQQALRILRSDYARFLQLERVGFLGDEPRLDWVENVRGIAAGLGLGGIRYQLSPRQPYSHPLITNTSPFEIHVTRMVLDTSLAHEGELLSFFAQLQARDSGLFDIEYCKLERIHDDDRVVLTGPNLQMHCELNWYSLAQPQYTESDLDLDVD